MQENQVSSQTSLDEPATHFNHLFDSQVDHIKSLKPPTASDIPPNVGSEGGIVFADEKISHSSGVLSREQFIQLYSAGFKTAGAVSGFKSLNIEANNPATIEGLGALYDSFNDISWLNFMLSPGNKWWSRGFAISALFVPMISGVANEMNAKKVTKKTPEQPKEEPKPTIKNDIPDDVENHPDDMKTLAGMD